MAHEVEDLNRLLAQPELGKSDIKAMMVDIRKLLEERSKKSEYVVLNLYCNWTVHTKIEQSMVCFRMLEELTDNIIKHKDTPPNSALFAGVTQTLRVRQLREEFALFCKEFSLSDLFCNDDSIWKEFFSMLTSILIDNPIRFPNVTKLRLHNKRDRKVKAIYDAICSKVGNRSFGVKGFSFFVRQDGEGHDSGELWWKVDLIPSETAIPKTVALTGKFLWVG